MYLHPGQAFAFIGYTHGSTGALANADSLPTGFLYHNGVVDGTVTVTVTNPATGKYKLAGTLPNTYVEGDTVSLEINATVGGVSDAEIVIDAVITTALPNAVAGTANGLPIMDSAGVGVLIKTSQLLGATSALVVNSVGESLAASRSNAMGHRAFNNTVIPPTMILYGTDGVAIVTQNVTIDGTGNVTNVQ
jgi:hypothetical protein